MEKILCSEGCFTKLCLLQKERHMKTKAPHPHTYTEDGALFMGVAMFTGFYIHIFDDAGGAFYRGAPS